MRKISIAPTINLEAITIQDCINMYTYKHKAVVINDGKVKGFVKEERNGTNVRTI